MILRSQNQQFFFKDQRGLPNLIYRTPLMRIVKVSNDNAPIEGKFDVLVSELPLAYLQGIRDAKRIDAVLIGSNGAEVQMK